MTHENLGPGPDKPEAPLSFDDRDPLVLRAAVTAAATAVVHVGVVLGIPGLSSAVETAIGGAVDAAGLVVLLVLARRKTTPNAKVVARVTTRGRVVAGEAAEQPTETVVGKVDPAAVDAQLNDEPTGPALAVTVRPELLADHPHHGSS